MRSYEHTKKPRRMNQAYKLLALLLYSGLSCFRVGEYRKYIYIMSFRELASHMGVGTNSTKVRKWLLWLEDRGYVETVLFTPNKRQAKVVVRLPSNVGGVPSV